MSAFLDGCRFNPAAGGTADWTYASAVTGYQSPAAANAVNGATYSYRAESADLSQWEMGVGTFNTGTGVLARTTVLFNSLGTTAKVSFSTVPQVAIVALAEDLTRANFGLGTVGHVPGANSGTPTAPAAGEIGEVILGSGSATLTTGVIANVASVALTVGIWDISGTNDFGGPGATTTSDVYTAISSQATPTLTVGIVGAIAHNRQPAVADYSTRHSMPAERIVLTANASYYMHAECAYTAGSSYGCSGRLRAVRVV
jgi:hypothetical protein